MNFTFIAHLNVFIWIMFLSRKSLRIACVQSPCSMWINVQIKILPLLVILITQCLSVTVRNLKQTVRLGLDVGKVCVCVLLWKCLEV